MGKIAKRTQNMTNDGEFVGVMDNLLVEAQPEVWYQFLVFSFEFSKEVFICSGWIRSSIQRVPMRLVSKFEFRNL